MDYKVPGHSIYAEMEDVHDKMISRYELNKDDDEERAKTMESYLRYFKKVGNKDFDDNLVGNLQYQALSNLAQDVSAALGISDYSLFRMKHNWYLDSRKRWDADDVFEAEFKAFLDAAVTRATSGSESSDASIIGSLVGNVSKEFLEAMSVQGQSMIDKEYVDSSLIQQPTFKSAKVDVESFSGEFTISTQLKPEWKKFIDVFKGVNFTVKNYSSSSSHETIYLGNTTLAKSVGSTLNTLYAPSQAAHIYYHAINYVNKGDGKVGSHVLHLRFAYELAGDGLYDAEGNKLSAADFFIYNDPSSDNIWVRSTKSMIQDATSYMKDVKDPYRSDIVILKNSFT